MLDYFALLIIIVLILFAVGVWIILAILPGQIAKKRNHHQAEAINICGWCGAISMGILSPIAFIWAYTTPRETDKQEPQS